MRKLLTLATIFACMFTFAGCNDDDDKEELKSVKYTIEAWFDTDFTGIYIYEFNEKGDKLKTNTLYSLKRNETETYTSAKGCKKLKIYAKNTRGCIYQEEDFFSDVEKITLGVGIYSSITEDEYNFYTK